MITGGLKASRDYDFQSLQSAAFPFLVALNDKAVDFAWDMSMNEGGEFLPLGQVFTRFSATGGMGVNWRGGSATRGASCLRLYALQLQLTFARLGSRTLAGQVALRES